jgi:hypothetical protein
LGANYVAGELGLDSDSYELEDFAFLRFASFRFVLLRFVAGCFGWGKWEFWENWEFAEFSSSQSFHLLSPWIELPFTFGETVGKLGTIPVFRLPAGSTAGRKSPTLAAKIANAPTLRANDRLC